MRDKIEFDANSDAEGRIHVPPAYIERLRSKADLHVTVEDASSKASLNPAPFLKRVRENPFLIPNFRPLTRDELYDR